MRDVIEDDEIERAALIFLGEHGTLSRDEVAAVDRAVAFIAGAKWYRQYIGGVTESP